MAAPGTDRRWTGRRADEDAEGAGCFEGEPIKTDRRITEGIARLLQLGWFRPVHCKSVSAQEVRALLGARKAVQQGFIALELSLRGLLRGLLRNFGLKVGAGIPLAGARRTGTLDPSARTIPSVTV